MHSSFRKISALLSYSLTNCVRAKAILYAGVLRAGKYFACCYAQSLAGCIGQAASLTLAARRAAKDKKGMLDILFVGTPFKILNAVIGLYTVFMVYLFLVFWVRYKVLSNYTMENDLLMDFISRKTGLDVTINIY